MCGFSDVPASAPSESNVPPRPSQDITNTRAALLLMAIGVVGSSLPIGGGIADIVLLVGGALLFSSGRPFGKAHRRNAMLGLVLGFGGAAASALSTLFISRGLPAPPSNLSDVVAWLESVRATILFALLIAIVLGGLSAFGLVVITYSLQDRTGRALLWLTFALAIGIGLAEYVILSQAFDLVISEVTASAALDPASLAAISADLNGLVYLQILPQALFAACYFLADLRIRHGAIPAPVGRGTEA